MLKKTLVLLVSAIAIVLIIFYGVGIYAKWSGAYKVFGITKSDVVSSKQKLSGEQGVAFENIDDYCVEYLEVSGQKINLKVSYNNCSKNKPSFCKEGKIISDCKLCGCTDGESCNSNGECSLSSIKSLSGGGGAGGGGGGGAGGGEEGSGGGGGGAGGSVSLGSQNASQEIVCEDSDNTNSPSPIYFSGSCSDEEGSYSDACKDPVSGGDSTAWVKEYKCMSALGTRVCIAEYKSCPSNSQNYFQNSSSTCSSSRCTIPSITIESCSDNLKNQDETNIDCGGVCGGYFYDNNCNLNPQATCSDGIKNQDETSIDCGGSTCSPCQEEVSCSDGIKNQGEEEVDCGGPCIACEDSENDNDEETCYLTNTDSKGLTIFTYSTCNDESGSYTSACKSPIGDTQSDLFIKTYVCVSGRCSPKYYSCPVMGENHFGTSYTCSEGVCVP